MDERRRSTPKPLPLAMLNGKVVLAGNGWKEVLPHQHYMGGISQYLWVPPLAPNPSWKDCVQGGTAEGLVAIRTLLRSEEAGYTRPAIPDTLPAFGYRWVLAKKEYRKAGDEDEDELGHFSVSLTRRGTVPDGSRLCRRKIETTVQFVDAAVAGNGVGVATRISRADHQSRPSQSREVMKEAGYIDLANVSEDDVKRIQDAYREIMRKKPGQEDAIDWVKVQEFENSLKRPGDFTQAGPLDASLDFSIPDAPGLSCKPKD